MLTAARESLKTLGMRDRQALIVQHTDRAHRYCHIVVNRVSPEDGRAASRTHDARALSTWARTWERERGGIRCHGRPVPPVERAVAVVTHVVTKHELPPRPPVRSGVEDQGATAPVRVVGRSGRNSTTASAAKRRRADGRSRNIRATRTIASSGANSRRRSVAWPTQTAPRTSIASCSASNAGATRWHPVRHRAA